MHQFKLIDRYAVNFDRLCYADLEVYEGDRHRGGEPKVRLHYAGGVAVTLAGRHAEAVRDFFRRTAAPLGAGAARVPFDTTSTAEVAAAARPAGPPPFAVHDDEDLGPVS